MELVESDIQVQRKDKLPIYEFLCDGCGLFEERRSFEEAGEPAVCPVCASAARRVYSAPNLKPMPAPLSNAMNRAERSAHEPGVARRPEGGTRYHPDHGGHHGH